MSTNINIGKPLLFTFNESITGSKVVFLNRTTGESIQTDDKNDEITINQNKKTMFDANWFSQGWTVGDVIECKVSGKRFGSNTITLTASTSQPQSVTVTTTASSLATGGL